MSKLTDIFNGTTIKGRANVAKATYASFAFFYLVHRLRNRGRKSNENKANNQDIDGESHKYLPDNNYRQSQDHKKEADVDCCSCGCSRNKAHSHGNDKYRKNHEDFNSGNSHTDHYHKSERNDHIASKSKSHINDHDDVHSAIAGAAVIHSSSKTCESSSGGMDSAAKNIVDKDNLSKSENKKLIDV
ncbi:uncharacterized protein [Musca autumnalis]|uniref:uncharacterized protein n=1 Tax=Musca autumnalis TaxID=221902 RepID=UPI003CFA3F56